MTSDSVDPDDAVAPDDFPLIGEPLPIEFANSLYETDSGSIDFLATPSLAQTWFRLAASDAALPTRLRRADIATFRELRNAVRRMFCDLANGAIPDRLTVSVVNRYAALDARTVRLVIDHDGRLAIGEHRHGTTIDATLGRLAGEAILLAGGPKGRQLRQCTGPGCAMLFVKDHHKRRWCDHSCGHRARQAAYYRRKKALTPHRTS